MNELITEQGAAKLIHQLYAERDVTLGDGQQLANGDWLILEANGEACYMVDPAGYVAEYTKTGGRS